MLIQTSLIKKTNHEKIIVFIDHRVGLFLNEL